MSTAASEIKKNTELSSMPESPLLTCHDRLKEKQEKIARGISQSFLKQILELKSKPEHLALLEILKIKLKKQKKIGLIKLYEAYNNSGGDSDFDHEACFEPRGIKITKGIPIFNEEQLPICDDKGNQIIFDFSILIFTSGTVIALGEESGTGHVGQGRIAVDLNDLSRGLFAKVYRFFEDKPSAEKLAKRGGPYAKADNKKFKREIRKHKALKSFHGCVVTKHKAYLIQDRAIGQDLFYYAYALDQEMSQEPIFINGMHTSKLLRAAISMCAELQRYHANGIIHRDVKPENYIYDESTQNSTLVDIETLVFMNRKITKPLKRVKKPGKEKYSGLVEIPGRKELVFYAPLKKAAGTPRYLAPEICKTVKIMGVHSYLPETYKGMYSFASDRYSLGASIELLFSKPLYFLRYNSKLIDKHSMFVFMDVVHLVKGLKDEIPDNRITIDCAIEQLKRDEKLLDEELLVDKLKIER